MPTGVQSWSTTAASNATADTNVNWAEGQAPSSVNDSARATMASVAMWRDDTNGSITTGGSAGAYTVTSNQSFASLAAMDNAVIAFVPHATNTAGSTLAVDGLTAKKIRMTTGVDLQDGVLIAGTPYVVTYENGNGEFLLHNLAGSMWMCPIGAGFDYWGTTAPTSHFAFPYGQAISRTTYSVLFDLIGTTHGVGDGSTTFNLPDKRGRVSAGKDNMGGSAANRLTSDVSIAGSTLGTAGGSQSHTLTTAQLPAHSHGVTDPGHSHSNVRGAEQVNGLGPGTSLIRNAAGGSESGTFSTQSATTGITINNAGSGNEHPIVQPTIICNYLMRII